MSITVEAIYENGVFRPQQPITLPPPPVCASLEALTWNGSAFQCVEVQQEPSTTSLNCTTIASRGTVTEPGSFKVSSGSCPGGFELTGGGFNLPVIPPLGFVLKGSRPDDNELGWLCRFATSDTSTVDVECWARCCQVVTE